MTKSFEKRQQFRDYQAARESLIVRKELLSGAASSAGGSLRIVPYGSLKTFLRPQGKKGGF